MKQTNKIKKSLVIKPKKEKSRLKQMFNGYDTNKPYPFEVVDKGNSVTEKHLSFPCRQK